jgi:hypothetical protein
MDDIAALTGGVAYYLRNDLDVAIREAMDDGRVSYTLGFYPFGDDRAAQVHRLAVKVSRPGVVLRYRTSYETEAPRPLSGATKTDLLRALNRPIDATAIPIEASATSEYLRHGDAFRPRLPQGTEDPGPRGRTEAALRESGFR